MQLDIFSKHFKNLPSHQQYFGALNLTSIFISTKVGPRYGVTEHFVCLQLASIKAG